MEIAKRRGQRELPTVVVTSEVSQKPGGLEELEKLLLRWDLMIAKKAHALLKAVKGG